MKQGISYISDVASEMLLPLVQQGKITAGSDFGVLAEADVIILVFNTIGL